MEKITTFSEYSKRAAETQMESCKNEDYLRFGLISEVGELCAIFKRAIRGDFKLEDKRQDILLELGDICWYLNRLGELRGWELPTAYDESNILAFETGCGEWVNLSEPKNVIWFDAAQIIISVVDRFGSPAEQTDAWMNIAAVACCFDYTLTDVLTANVEKLAKRKERGLIQGSGDHRGEQFGDAAQCGCAD